MRREPVVVVIGTSIELELALGALEDLELPILAIPTVREAQRRLVGSTHPRVAAILLELGGDPPDGAVSLVRALRAAPGLGTVPIAVWAPRAAAHLLAEAYRVGASSGVLLDGTYEDAVLLAQVVHYWAAANEPRSLEASA